MKVTVHAEGTAAEIAKQLSVHAAVYASTTAPTKTPKGKASKAEPEEEEEDADFTDSDDEETESEDSAEEEDTDSDDSEDDADEEDTLNLKTVIAGFKAYAKKHSRDKAAAVLKQFKVKSVQDLKKTQYPLVMKALKK